VNEVLPVVLPLQSVCASERLRGCRAVRLAESTFDIGGGIACRRRSGAWLNVAVGLGLTSRITDEEACRIVQWFSEADKDARVEVADRAVGLDALAQAGFRLSRLVSVLSLDLRRFTPQTDLGSGIALVKRLDPDDATTVASSAVILTRAFATTDAPLCNDDVQVNVDALSHPGASAFVALVNDHCVGVGMVEVEGSHASLWGAAVMPEYRRLGVQRALLEARLQYAVDSGATLAFVETDSGGPTHRNAARLGFTLAYSRAVLVRPR
jgi:GNAT superfamily N-acetyltransferase